MTIQARQAAHRLGHVAEWRAVWRLRLAGYSVLARRYKTKLGEIDIVVRRGGILAFVEVKARADFLTATDALGNRQFGRVARGPVCRRRTALRPAPASADAARAVSRRPGLSRTIPPPLRVDAVRPR